MKNRKNIVYGVYSEEHDIIEAVREARSRGMEIYDVY